VAVVIDAGHGSGRQGDVDRGAGGGGLHWDDGHLFCGLRSRRAALQKAGAIASRSQPTTISAISRRIASLGSGIGLAARPRTVGAAAERVLNHVLLK
jgi:hypothetical protein